MRHTSTIAFLGVLLAIAGCATTRVQGVAQPLHTGGQAVTIEMSGFNFIPNVIALQAGMPVTITARETVTFDATLPAPGPYVFYCDLWLHRWPFGMEGTLVAR